MQRHMEVRVMIEQKKKVNNELDRLVAFDRSLKGRSFVGVYPNDNTATVMLSFEDLFKVITEHGNQIHIIDL